VTIKDWLTVQLSPRRRALLYGRASQHHGSRRNGKQRPAVACPHVLDKGCLTHVLESETSPAVKPLLTSHGRLGCGQSMPRQPRSAVIEVMRGGHRAGRYVRIGWWWSRAWRRSGIRVPRRTPAAARAQYLVMYRLQAFSIRRKHG
jgi:hypothetical protein